MPKKQSFSDHINELRLRLLVWFIFFILGSVIGFIKSSFLLALLIKPLGEPLFYTSPMGGFNFIMQTAILFGFLVSLPVLIYQIIKFCQPVLSTNIKKIVPKMVLFSFILLIISLVIAFYIFIPAAIHFLKGFGGEQIQALITTSEYFSFILVYLIGLSILFQMPVIILLINYISPLTTKQLMKWQKIMIVLSFIVAAILTPTPDPINQTIMALPIIFLYELSIILVWFVNRGRKPLEEDANANHGVIASAVCEAIHQRLPRRKQTPRNDKRRLYYLIFIPLIIGLIIISYFAYARYKQSHKTTSPENNTNQQTTEIKDSTVEYISQNANATDVSSDTAKFIVAGQSLITTRKNSSDLYRQTLGEKNEAKIIHSLPENLEIADLYFDEINNRILVITTNNRIFNVSLVDNSSIVEIDPPVGESWPSIRSLTTYLNNIYILENETGLIWKYASADGKIYQPKSPYLVDSSLSDKNAQAIASDGSIYVLFSDGKISKFLRGTSDKFTSPILPTPNDKWQSPTTIFANASETSKNVYIQNNDKIVEITKHGEYQRQFVLENKQISATYISEKDKKGWVLSVDKIYQFEL